MRHANSNSDVDIRCGCKINRFGILENTHVIKQIKKKILNMKFITGHFIGQRVPDDILRTIVRENNYLTHVLKKCGMRSESGKKTILKWIFDLGIDMSHFKTKKQPTGLK